MRDVEKYKHLIRAVPDFPIEGVLFRDVTNLFLNAEAFSKVIEELAKPYRDMKLDYVAGIDARGFILGGALARELNCGFVAIRKQGKLPGATVKESYALEYGEATIEIQKDCIPFAVKVVLIDDLIATGGTALASLKLLQSVGAKVVSADFLVDLRDLGGAKELEREGVSVRAIFSF